MAICGRIYLKNFTHIHVILQRNQILYRSIYNTSSTNILNIEMETEKKAFCQELPKIINSLKENPKFLEMPEVGNWIQKMLQYNLVGGKNARGLTTVISYKMIEKENKITDESLRLARTLGWCVEMFQAYCVILDDIMDGSTTRRGMPCWYCKPDVGLACAINDSIIVYSTLFQVLKDNFMMSPNYVNMFQLFNETLWFTALGQHLDYITAQRKQYNLFTLDRYYTMIKHKASYYTYYLPVSLGLLLVESVEKEMFKQAHNICLEIGKLFQIQDDYIDCFGDESVTGKAGTDIQEGKCTWLAVNALLRCNEAQCIVFKSCYGSKEPAHVERIKQLYVQLRLPEIYQERENSLYKDILELTTKIPDPASQKLYRYILNTTYKRKQ
ncbi:farnesyl pyrophosphate synthase 1 [Manduca sexta]|uniref:farnesyl pyrophosphate synthase 1 n=1 Tax=Manduca sexta TaxID=7130 RepID=UPI00188E1FA2|nr:farnesyl pyrophosphate synthase 1 [Manduca sexta]